MKKNAKNSINYDAKFKIMVILDVVKNDLPVRVAVRKYWNVTTREEIDRYRQNVRYWRRADVKWFIMLFRILVETCTTQRKNSPSGRM